MKRLVYTTIADSPFTLHIGSSLSDVFFLISAKTLRKSTPKYCIHIGLHVVDTVKEPNRSHSILATNRRLGEFGGQGAVRGKERVLSLAARMPMPQGVGQLERSNSGQSVRGRRRAKSNKADKLHLRSVI